MRPKMPLVNSEPIVGSLIKLLYKGPDSAPGDEWLVVDCFPRREVTRACNYSSKVSDGFLLAWSFLSSNFEEGNVWQPCSFVIFPRALGHAVGIVRDSWWTLLGAVQPQVASYPAGSQMAPV